MDSPYDIYIVAHVDELKAELVAKDARIRELVRENALLNERLDRHRRAACYRESEREAANCGM